VFERIVAENGAVLYDPGGGTVEVLAPAPPPALLEALAQQAVPVSVGHSILATVEPYEHQVLAAIRDLALEWHVIFNKGSVMALPAAITKATGLAQALDRMGITPERTVGVGDAENDQAFLRSCGLAVAVDNALPTVKELSHVVTAGARGAGVVEFIDRLLAGDFDTLSVSSPGERRMSPG
jgi:hydroxymethylpyrimidine pyrophosphatase-like HAD family hydrolase